MKAIAAYWCLIIRTWVDTLAALIVCPTLGRRHQHVARCCRNIQPSSSKCLGIQKVCLGFKRIHRNADKNILKNLKTHDLRDTIGLLHYKTKIDAIQGVALIHCSYFNEGRDSTGGHLGRHLE